jgi:hypothetical protein
VGFIVSTNCCGSCNAAGIPSGAADVVLDDEQRAVLRDAARMTSDPGLAPELERLVLVYKQERRAGKPPTMGEVRRRLLTRAAAMDAARRALRGDPWAEGAVGEVRDLAMAEIAGIDLATRLAGEARRARVAAADIPVNDRRPADRQPAAPLWRLGWRLAELWHAAGNRVATGPSSRFYGFCAQVAAAADTELPERMTNEIARQWSRKVGGLTEEPEKAPLLSLVG